MFVINCFNEIAFDEKVKILKVIAKMNKTTDSREYLQ